MATFKQTLPNRRRAVSIRLTASLLAAAAGGALFSAAPLGAIAAPAAEPYVTATTTDGVPAVAVKYGDLNLATERGARILFARIQVAADEVCPAVEDNRALGQIKAHTLCVRGAVSRAVEQVDSPRLAAVLSAQSRHG